jgi:NACHT domain
MPTPRRYRPTPTAVVVSVLGAVVAYLVNQLPSLKDLGISSFWVIVVTAVVVLLVAPSVASWSDRGPVGGEVRAWRNQLVDKYRRGLRAHRRVEPPLHVRWSPATATLERWDEIVEEADAAGGRWRERRGTWPSDAHRLAGSLGDDDNSLVTILLDRVPLRRLLIEGDSGTGKTVLLRQLADDLIQRAPDGCPYPLLVSVASWNPRLESLDDWLVRQLVRDYPPLGHRRDDRTPSVAATLVARHEVLPILDGLDEIGDDDERDAAVRRINDWLRDGNRPGLVVAARPANRPSAPIRTMSTVRLDELDPADVTRYLDAHADRYDWTDVLHDQHALRAALRRPLVVGLVTTIYGARDAPDPRRLPPVADDDAMTQQLMGMFLPATYEREPPSRWRFDRVQRWLRSISTMTGGSGRPGGDSIVWWELRDRAPRLVPVVLALPPGLAVGLVAGLYPGLGIGLGCGIITGVAVGLMIRAGVDANSATGSDPRPPRDRRDDVGPGIGGGFLAGALGAALAGYALYTLNLTERPLQGVMGGLAAGIAAGAASGVGPGIVGGLYGGIAVALTTGLGAGWPAGVVDGFAAWLAGAVVLAGPRLPARATRSPDLRVAAATAIGVGGAIGITVGIVHGRWAGLAAGVVIGVAGGAAAGLSFRPLDTGGVGADPHAVLVSDRTRCLTMAGFGGLAFGGGAAVTVNPWVGGAAALTVGLISGATRTAWPGFVVARLWFAVTRRLPLRLLTFLADGYDRDVLRQNGAGYQIRHQELREYLLETKRSPA